MVSDHAEAGNELTSKGMEIATAPMPVDEQAAKNISSLKGDAFDSAVATKVVDDHKRTFALLSP
jgi:predicted outer membrane protein